MKNILLLTDFTAKSANAHEYAFEYFKNQDCLFHLLSIQKVWEYTMDDLMVAGSQSTVEKALLGDNRSKVSLMQKRYTKRFKESTFTFECHVDYDVFSDAVSQAVKAYNIDFVVCGTDGVTGIVEKIFSSHTLRIIRNVDCPVLVIPQTYTFQKPERIHFLLDYDDVFEMCGKERLIELVRNHKSHIHVLRLTFGYDMEPIECEEEHHEIQKFFPSNPVTYNTFIDKDPIKVIDNLLMKEPVQMQVLSAKHQTFLERIFSNSHLSKIVNSTRIPLLILRDCNS